MDVALVMSGRAKLEDIQGLLLSEDARKVLRAKLRALLSTGAILGPHYIRHARYRPGRSLVAYCDVRVRPRAGEEYATRPIAVTWGSGAATQKMDSAKIDAKAVPSRLAAPFRQLNADFPELSMKVLVSPLDERFAQLARLSDPGYVRRLLTYACASVIPVSDPCRLSNYTVTPIRYRPGKRHVLRYDTMDSIGRTVFAKLYKGDDGERVWRVARHAADWLAEHGEGTTSVVRPLAHLPKDAAVLYPFVPGTPLSKCLRYPGGNLALCLERTGAALHALHRLPKPLVSPLKVHDFDAEIGEIARASQHIPALLPLIGTAIDALLDHARVLHDRLPQEAPSFTHGDFKSEHLYLAPGGLTLIDFDTSRFGDPAVDIGKFLADLRWWYASRNQAGLSQACEPFLAGYDLDAREGRLMRARLYEAVELVKLTARRVCLFENDWARRTAQLVWQAEALIDELQMSLGLSLFPGARTRRTRHSSNVPALFQTQCHQDFAKGGCC